MQPQFQVTGQATQEVSRQHNRVLRNTYMLLALSMVPTVIGALVGVQSGFSFFAGSPLISFLVFMGVAFAFMWGIERTKHSAMGVVLLLGFTFFMGLMLSRILQVALGFFERCVADRDSSRRHGRNLLHIGGRRDRYEKGFQFSRQVPFHRFGCGDSGRSGQCLLPDSGAVTDDLRRRRADFLCVHPS